MAIVGFSDDTNFLACKTDIAHCITMLEEAWQVCDEWTRERSMAFEPAKSSLLHLTREQTPRLKGVSPGTVKVMPQADARFLGIILDRKLNFRATVVM